MTNFESVRKFMEIFGQEIKEKASFPKDKITSLRYDLIKEELEELKEAIDNLKKSDNVYVNDTKDMIFVFNTLFESDKISNDMKKSVWKDLIYSLSYE